MMRCLLLSVLLVCNVSGYRATTYTIDDSVGLGRTFDGIGAISGGGATSKLLVNYPEQQRSEILDFLFKPNFGASLHIFKVEIGGDIQSTDGTEASHMHYGWDEDYTRGYEWWMLQEAKKRNPNIKLYCLPWGFPGWLRDSTDQPWKDIATTAEYIVKWINGAKVHYNLTMDYVGIWNESPYNITYIKTLRKTLDMAGFKDTLIIASDQNGWKIADDVAKDPELAEVIYALGSHYPKYESPEITQKSGKPIWASEDSVENLAQVRIIVPNAHKAKVSSFLKFSESTHSKVGGEKLTEFIPKKGAQGSLMVCNCIKDRSHYPNYMSPTSAKNTGKPLWASEDRTSGDDVTRGGCLARTLNRNYVQGYMTSTIMWNVVSSYYYGLPWIGAGLMRAAEPWSGYYDVSPPIWMAAHTTQFTEIGWKYFKHGYGVGNFTNGGTYVTLTNPEETELTIIIETLDIAECTSPEIHFGSEKVTAQSVILQLKGKFSQMVSSLNVWYSQPGYSKAPPIYFTQMDPINVTDGAIPLTLGNNEVWTLTTINTGNKGSYPNVPDPKHFPLPYTEDFEGYRVGEEPFYFSQQIGSFEAGEYQGRKFMQQVVIDEPVHWYWCHVDNANTSLNVFGDFKWQDISASVAVQIQGENTSDAVFLALRATNGGCNSLIGTGLFLFFYPKEQRYMLTTDLLRNQVLSSGTVHQVTNNWDLLTLEAKGDRVVGAVNSEVLFNQTIPRPITNGWVALGTYPFGIAWFDDFQVEGI